VDPGESKTKAGDRLSELVKALGLGCNLQLLVEDRNMVKLFKKLADITNTR
jgi:hypothetical protein